MLQKEVTERGAVVFNAPGPTETVEAAAPKATTHRFFGPLGHNTPGTTAPLPADEFAIAKEVPLERWVFGQYNRLLPAKASCRALARKLASEPNGLSLKEAALTIADAAVTLGATLKRHDEQHGIERDEWISTAFPIISAQWDRNKTVMRYANHFVAGTNKGRLSGLLADLKLINQIEADEFRFALTEPGWRFALLPNPLLDGGQDDPRQKFFDNERELLLEHIVLHVPAERFAYTVILEAIDGVNYTPDKLDSVLVRYLSESAQGAVTKSFTASQRSGAISRMADLGLVARIRKGVNVTYAILRPGRDFLARASD
jgi:hypothetical protein